ncbi:MAG: TatD family hydrolase [Eubacteriales bacterium]|nr:TatD family hydrolase [Eubacteriales bacterium]
MIIDFHTHTFPDAIAQKTIQHMEQISHSKAHLTGSLSALKQSMIDNNIDYSVLLPVVTKPSQFDTINQVAANYNNKDGIISFGGIHPDNDHADQKLEYIKSLGLKGIKLHPDYQGTFIDDPKYISIIKKCIELDLCVVIHAGLDIGLPTPIHCPVDRAYLALEEILKNCNKDSKIVLAHVGGHLQWELVETLLVGKNVYFDLAYSPTVMNRDTLIRIIQNHGTDHILFATDSPWSHQGDAANYIKDLPFTQNELDEILYKNAANLLGLSQ